MSTADTEPVTVEGRLAWFRDHDQGRYPLCVMEGDGQVAGWLSCQPYHQRPAYHITAEVSVYVAPQHHRRGIGSRLMDEAIRWGPRLGVRNLVGLVFGHNEASVGLFRGKGFQEWGRLLRVAELDGVERDVVIFGRRVDGQDLS